MLVLVCGDRFWRDRRTIRMALMQYPDATVIHGGARGADRIADEIGKSLGLTVTAFPADWKKHGLAAGPIRNRKMLDLRPDVVLAFHTALEISKGTRDCVQEARRRGIHVRLWTQAKKD